MRNTTFEKEISVSREGVLVVGVDEVGRGPLAGPVVAAAACFKDPSYDIPMEEQKNFRFIRDSKTLSEKKREMMDEFVRKHFWVAVGQASEVEIGRLNILQASLLAMRRAVEALRRVTPGADYYLLIDGNQKLIDYSDPQEALIGGDGLCKSIAAASIVAKAARDRMMFELDQTFPVYRFAKNKGYGTREHMEALRKYGPTPHHRKSFAPVMMTNPDNVNKRFAQILKPKR